MGKNHLPAPSLRESNQQNDCGERTTKFKLKILKSDN